MSSFQRLRAEIGSADNKFAADGDWSSIESSLGLCLPSDYKAFIGSYGSGKICNFVSVLSPFTNNTNWNLISYAKSTVTAYQSYVETNLLASLPYAMHPKKGGLLPFGTTENCNCINWLTKGKSEKWKIVVWMPDMMSFFKTGHNSLLAFLADIVQQRCGLFPKDSPIDWFDPPRGFNPIDFDSAEWSNL